MRAEVLVIGAGPAGSLAARSLAGAGLSVVLADRSAFPRDKACGDALLPDALAALRSAGLDRTVLAGARRLQHIDVWSPDGTRVRIDGDSAVLPRATLDEALRRAATAAGATFLGSCAVVEAHATSGLFTGARFHNHRTGETFDVSATVTLLATGAATGPLRLFGVATREAPSATAARLYVRADSSAAAVFDGLCISYDRAICPGYGWIFPGPDQTFNVGVGYFHDVSRRPPTTNLRDLLATFSTTFPPAIELLERSTIVSPLRGAPLRTALTGSQLARPGLLVIGEAAGLTYSFTGEGIGKAMDSGLRAAALVGDALRSGRTDLTTLADRYAAEITAAFADRFRAYKNVQDWLESPTVANLLARRANRGTFVRRQLQGLVTETTDPAAIFSPLGIVRALVT